MDRQFETGNSMLPPSYSDVVKDIQPFTTIANTPWLLYAGIGRQQKILFIDYWRLGGIKILSAVMHTVHTLAPSFSEAQRLNRFILENNLFNVKVTVGTCAMLPYRSGFFDSIILGESGSLLSKNSESRDPRMLLREFRRVMKNGGAIYLGNRKKTLLKRPAQILPGTVSVSNLKIADALHKVFLKPQLLISCYPDTIQPHLVLSYPIYPRSLPDLYRMIRFIALRNSYIVKLKASSRENSHPVNRIRNPETHDESIVKSALKRLDKLGPGKQKIEKCCIGSADCFVLVAPDHVIRIPLSDLGRERCDNNFKMLNHLLRLQLPFKIPRA